MQDRKINWRGKVPPLVPTAKGRQIAPILRPLGQNHDEGWLRRGSRAVLHGDDGGTMGGGAAVRHQVRPEIHGAAELVPFPRSDTPHRVLVRGLVLGRNAGRSGFR